jgi:hypothetical protein
MKHIVFVLSILTSISFMFPTSVLAQTATPRVTPTSRSTSAPTPTGGQLDDLKARLATKVAELRTVVKRAMHGTVKTVSVSQAVIETKTKDIKIELTDDVALSQIVNNKRVTLSLDDLEADDIVTVFGAYDETLDLLKAQYIFIENALTSTRVRGIVTDSDEKEFTLVIKTPEDRVVTIDVETSTKTSTWTGEGGLAKAGFSKIQIGDTVHIVGTPVAKEENRVRATRILDLGALTGAGVTTPTQVSPTASPSATPRSTPRPTTRPTARPTLEP